MKPEEALKYSDDLEKQIKARKKVSPDDESGIVIRNNAKNLSETFQFLFVIGLIVTFIGLGTLLAGIIAVSYTHLDVYKRQVLD